MMLTSCSFFICFLIYLQIQLSESFQFQSSLLSIARKPTSFKSLVLKNSPLPQISPDQYDIGPPPDLPSLLFANRVLYVGMPIVPSVTELMVAELLYLDQQNQQPITLYINSPGTNSPDGQKFSFDTEAFAIADTLEFVKSPIHTICLGHAYGTAAMLLSLGQKGHRYALPNAAIMLHQPRTQGQGSITDIAIKAKEALWSRQTTAQFLSQSTGKSVDQVIQDMEASKYFSPEEAIAYGLIDHILEPTNKSMNQNTMEPSTPQILSNMIPQMTSNKPDLLQQIDAN